MFFVWLNVRIYVPDFTQPLIELLEQCYCFVIVLLFRYFFAVWKLPSLTLCNYKHSRFRLAQFSTCRWAQRPNEVRWRPGQEASLAPPCSNLRLFGSICKVLKTVLVILLGLFGALRSHLASPAVIRRPHSDWAPGELCPPSLHPWVGYTKLVCFFYKFISKAWWQPWKQSSSENRNVIWKSYNWLKILQASKMKTKNQFQGCCQCSSWVQWYVCIVGLQLKGELDAFLDWTELWIEP